MDQALGDEDAGAMAHIAGCAHCRDDFEAYRDTMTTVRDNLPSPPVGYADRMWALIEPRLTPRRPPRWRVAMLATAATVACIAGLYAWRYTRPMSPSSPTKLEALHRLDAPASPEEQRILAGRDESQVLALLRSSMSRKMRIAAIRILALSGTATMSETLVELYHHSADPDTRRAIVRALFVRQDLAELEKLLEKERNPAVRHDIQLALDASHVHREYLTHGSGRL